MMLNDQLRFMKLTEQLLEIHVQLVCRGTLGVRHPTEFSSVLTETAEVEL